MDSCKPSNSITSDYTFYRSSMNDFSFTVVYKDKYGWNFSLTDSYSRVLENAKIGWNVDDHLIAGIHLPNFVNDYPEFFL